MYLKSQNLADMDSYGNIHTIGSIKKERKSDQKLKLIRC